jgi:hypothetical protein
MTLFIVISRVRNLGLTCFDGFLAGLILIANIQKNHIVCHNWKLRSSKRLFMMKNIYCDMHQLRSSPQGTRGEVTEKKRRVCKRPILKITITPSPTGLE